MTLSTNATVRDATAFVAAVQQAGGRTPTVLADGHPDGRGPAERESDA